MISRLTLEWKDDHGKLPTSVVLKAICGLCPLYFAPLQVPTTATMEAILQNEKYEAMRELMTEERMSA